MKKSSFVALIMWTVSGILFALGMCMALLPQWNAFTEGVILGSSGIIIGLISLVVWFKMTGRNLPKMNAKNIFRTLYTVVAVLVLGLGICMCLVWKMYIAGTLVGITGIVMLLALIPMIKGLK